MQRLFRNLRIALNLVLRYALVWVADAASIALTAWALPGIYFLRDTPLWYLHPFTVALAFGLLNALLRPVLIVLLLPITFVTLGLATLVLNAALFYVSHLVIPSFVIENFGAAVIGVLLLTLVNTLLGNLVRVSDDYSFYATLMNKFGSLTAPKEIAEHERGVVIVQVDGLSYQTLKRAIRRGKMPFVGSLIKRRQHGLRKWFSGLPSQTPAAQAGMFYGNNYDIPGFRWYDKRTKRLVVSSNASDMSALDDRIARDHESILKHGSCINSLVHGSAHKKLLTVSALSEKDIKHHRAELEDFAIFSLHPYLYTRAILSMIWDFTVDRVEAITELVTRKKPKLFRGIKLAFQRVVGNALFREITTFFVREDIARGMPVIYANYLGYDIVAHFAGPNSWDALNTLSGIDRHFKRINRAIRKETGKHYDLIILSDHGQSACTSFSTLYKKSLDKVIEDKLENRTVDTGGSSEIGYLNALFREMRDAEAAYGTRSIRGGRRTLERLHARMQRNDPGEQQMEGVVVCPNGNLGHVYFTERSERVTTEYIADRYRELLETLVAHPGIGFVITRNKEDDYLMMGKAGMRKLRSGVVEGTDPLKPYLNSVDSTLMVKALLTLSQYPSAGDLIVNGAVLADGRIVSFESQRGTHGGLGGEQNDPFIILPRRLRTRRQPVGNPVELHGLIRRLLPR